MITIRKAKPSDFSTLADVERSAAEAFRDIKTYDLTAIADMQPNSTDYYKSLPSESVLYVAISHNNEVLGFILALEIDNNAYIKELSVKRSAQGQGIGRKLVLRILEWAKDNNYSYVSLTTFRDLHFNGIFYQKMGFKEFNPNSHHTSQLYKIRESERTNGLDIIPRCAMIYILKIEKYNLIINGIQKDQEK